jgi:hypothetical protein
VTQVKAVACELPRTEGVPLSRFSRAELHRLVVERGVTDASAATIARWLAEDSLRPWQHRSWIFPTDPEFLERAGPVLDLYQGRWEGKLLHPGDANNPPGPDVMKSTKKATHRPPSNPSSQRHQQERARGSLRGRFHSA